jgi:hypothetical protein
MMMDSNALLDEILAIVGDAEAFPEDIPEGGAMEDLVHLLGHLDEWLTGGGFLPDRWNVPREDADMDREGRKGTGRRVFT